MDERAVRVAAVEERIARILIHMRPYALCDGCLARDLGVSLDEVGAAIRGMLTGSPMFHRERRACYRCDRTTEITSIR